MRICLISYEFPPDTGIGGIATYMYQLSKAFESNKIETEVICASPSNNGTIPVSDYLTITKIRCNNTEQFRKLAPAVASKRYAEKPFDLIEVPEYGAEGLYIKEKLPDVPLIVKLHTPKYLIKELNDYYYDQLLLRRIKKKLGFIYNKVKDPEYKAIQFADYILSPSLSLKKLVAEKWEIPSEKIIHAPNPYFPSKELLSLRADLTSGTVIYIGRLETRKGVFNLAKAIPAVIQKNPETHFIFLGRDSRGPCREKSMKQVMLKEIGAFSDHVSFIDHIPLEEVPGIIGKASVAVFPSLWENFPNVCLEAMSAGLGIVASCNGGMRDMLEDINGGLLIDPHDVNSISGGISQLLSNPVKRTEAGQRNREKASGYYGDRLVSELISLYGSFCIHSL